MVNVPDAWTPDSWSPAVIFTSRAFLSAHDFTEIAREFMSVLSQQSDFLRIQYSAEAVCPQVKQVTHMSSWWWVDSCIDHRSACPPESQLDKLAAKYSQLFLHLHLG